MDNITKRDYTIKIINSSPLDLLLINYELIFYYFDEVKKNIEDGEHFKKIENIKTITSLNKKLIESLNFKYELSGNLYSLYIYVNKNIVLFTQTGKIEFLSEAETLLRKLYTSFVEIAEIGENEVENKITKKFYNKQTQVYSGFTYDNKGLAKDYSLESAGIYV